MSAADKIAVIVNHTPGPVAALFRNDRILTRVLRPLLNRCLPSVATLAVVRSGPGAGLRLLIYPRQEKYYWTGTHEEPVQRALEMILRPGMTFWDVGAHIGFFSLLASRLVGDEGRVHCFEPLADNRTRLRTSIKANDCENITVHELAVAARSGEAVLEAHESSLMWSIAPRFAKRGGVRVSCCTIDELASDEPARSASPPDLIKVDAEGAEVDVLRGGLQLLSTAGPALVVEFSDEILLMQARALLPFYTFEELASHHWLLLDKRKSGAKGRVGECS